jgi:prolipoprotein diacylglyceryl transferase
MTCYPTISDMLLDVFGVNIPLPIQTFGFFVALAFMLSALILVNELKRKEKQGLLLPRTEKRWFGKPASIFDMLLNAFVGFLVGFKIVPLVSKWTEFSANPQEMIFSSEGSIVGGLIGAALLAFLKWKDGQKEKLEKPELREVQVWPHQRLGDLVTVAAIFGIIGARFMVLIENGGWEEFLSNPGANFFSGLSIYGGLLLGGPAVVLWARSKGINILHLGDAAAPVLFVGYGVGRMGCQFSGDGDWGVINEAAKPGWLSWAPDWVWAFDYPNNVNGDCGAEPCIDGIVRLASPVYPTPIYEILMAGILFGILWYLRKRIHISGMIFAIYFIMNGAERYLIEQIRVNSKHDNLGGMTQAEVVAIMFILFGIGLAYVRWTKAKQGLDKAYNQRPSANPET